MTTATAANYTKKIDEAKLIEARETFTMREAEFFTGYIRGEHTEENVEACAIWFRNTFTAKFGTIRALRAWILVSIEMIECGDVDMMQAGKEAIEEELIASL